jgi:hypothetical protein
LGVLLCPSPDLKTQPLHHPQKCLAFQCSLAPRLQHNLTSTCKHTLAQQIVFKEVMFSLILRLFLQYEYQEETTEEQQEGEEYVEETVDLTEVEGAVDEEYVEGEAYESTESVEGGEYAGEEGGGGHAEGEETWEGEVTGGDEELDGGEEENSEEVEEGKYIRRHSVFVRFVQLRMLKDGVFMYLALCRCDCFDSV